MEIPADKTDAGTDVDVTLSPVVVNKDSVRWEALILPHTPSQAATAGRFFAFNCAGDETRTWEVPNDVVFEAEKYYRIEFRLMRKNLTTTPDGMTNCYMVKPGDAVEFPVTRAYKDMTTLHVGDAYADGTFKVKVIWQEPDGLITSPTTSFSNVSGSGSTAEVTVQTASNKIGNALVGIYKSTDTSTPVWSYHIWVTEYTGDNTVTMANGHEFMDRNLGATANDLSEAAYGLLYQWGRKDPFMRSPNDPTYVTSSSTVGTIEYSIKYPDHFIKGVSADETNNDWIYGSIRNNTLWNERKDGHNIKTIYDPCPEGWRVPVYRGTPSVETSPWREYDESKYKTEMATTNPRVWSSTGYIFTHKTSLQQVIYPAAGRRVNTTGQYSGQGTNGFYWGAIATAGYRTLMQFDTGTVNAIAGHTGAQGYSVRCAR
jgi:hypothetical protein